MPMRWGKRIVLAVVILAVLALAGGVGSVYLYFRPGLPVTDGQLRVSGLKGSVEVIRDRWGVPHIYAQDEEDLFFAQGYVEAQDRFWQMELSRRAAQGTLAEVLGEPALKSDELARTLGFARDAQTEWDLLDADTRTALEAYARGVNAYLSMAGRQLPVEFSLLHYTPAPWQPLDSVAWARLVAWRESGDWQQELLHARLVHAVGPERAAELEPAGGLSLSLPGDLGNGAALAQALLVDGVGQDWAWGDTMPAGGSAWTVASAGTAGNRPILAADMAAPVQMPGAWYEIHLVGGRYDVIGGTLPGIPGVLSGRNRTIAFGSTETAGDTTDLYVERVRMQLGKAYFAASPLQAEYDGRWEQAQAYPQQIRVRGQGQPVDLTVHVTRHGPLLSAPSSQGEQVAVRWAGAGQPTAYTRCVLALDRASNWDDFQAVARAWTVPARTLVYADIDGNIGYAVAGTIPVRSQGDGSLPVPGWTGAYEWAGFVSPDALPQAHNPQDGRIVAAGNALAVSGLPEPTSPDTETSFRADRISQLLQAQPKLTAAQGEAVLNDDLGPVQPLLSHLLTLAPQGWIQERSMPYLRDWNLHYDADSAGAGIFETFYWRLAHHTLDDELGPDLVQEYLNINPDARKVLEGMATQPANPWFDDTRTPQQETRDDIFHSAFADALDWLGRRYGDLPYEWNWGRVHNIWFRHALGVQWPFTIWLNRGAMRDGGSASSVNATLPDYSERLAVGTASAYRMVIDLSASGQSLATTATGQSGNPLSGHYGDTINAWRQGQAHPLLYSRDAVLKAQQARLVLDPAN